METESCEAETSHNLLGDHNILWLFPSDDKLFIVVVQSSDHKLFECSDMLVGCSLKFFFTGLNGDGAVSFPGQSVINPYRTQRGKISNPIHAMCARFGSSSTNYKLYCGIFDSKFNYVNSATWQSNFVFIDNITINESFVGVDWVLNSKFLIQYRNGTSKHTL